MHRGDRHSPVVGDSQLVAPGEPVANRVELVVDDFLVGRKQDHLTGPVRERLEHAKALVTAQAGQRGIDDEREGSAQQFPLGSKAP